MSQPEQKPKSSRSLSEVFLTVLERRRKWIPTSFYLLFAIPVVLILGVRMGKLQDDPRQFFLILSLMFLFFGILFHRAIMDVFDLLRRNLLGTQDLYKDTFDSALRSEEAPQDTPPPDEEDA